VASRTLLDTDIFSEVIRDKNERVRARAEAYAAKHGKLLISSVTVLEVAKGLQKALRKDALDRFLKSLPTLEVINFGADEAVMAGRIYGDLERAGQPIGRSDPMIAGIAIVHGVVLATGNVDHYERIRALGYQFEIDNWREGSS
jgi:tRNA(fMet)-specific endonuclease VapC